MKELLARFRLLASGVWDEETMQRIIDTLARLDELESITGLAGLLSAPAQEGEDKRMTGALGRSCAGRNPESPGVGHHSYSKAVWIPACAGMTDCISLSRKRMYTP